MFRWIFLVGGGLLVLRVAALALADAYRAHPFLSVVIGAVVLFVGLAVLATVLDRRDGYRRIEVRRASQEYGPRTRDEHADPSEGDVGHVLHHHVLRVEHVHVVEHVHRYEAGEATVRRDGGVRYLSAGAVVDGDVVVRRAIEGGTT